jgi:hypothetical protein
VRGRLLERKEKTSPFFGLALNVNISGTVAAACLCLSCPAEDSSYRFAAPDDFRAEEAALQVAPAEAERCA